MPDQKTSRAVRNFNELGLVALGLSLALVAMPSIIITQNAEDVSQPLRYVFYFTAAAVGCLALFAVVFQFIPQRLATLVSGVFISYVIASIAADYFFPLEMGPLETGGEVASASIPGQLVQLGVFVGVIAALYLSPIRNVGAPALAAALAVTAAHLLPSMSALSQWEPVVAPAVDASDSPEKFNIYHFIFDTYYGPWFEYSRDAMGISEDEFSGFTHYAFAKSNYWATRLSVPSFLSGTVYSKEKGTVREWWEEANRSSVVSDLNERGYNTTVYAPNSRPGMGPAKQFHKRRDASPSLTLVSDLVVLRLAPPLVRPLLFREGKGPVGATAVRWSVLAADDMGIYSSYLQFQDFLRDEVARPSRGQYVLFHSMVPHPPYVLDRHGQVKSSSYDEQMFLATGMMKQIVALLREQGKLDDSLVILQSDHGVSDAADSIYKDQGRLFVTLSGTLSKLIQKTNLKGKNGRRLEARYSPLLLIKPPARCTERKGDFTVSSDLVELVDIRDFVSSMFDYENVRCEFPKKDEVIIYSALEAHLKDGKMNILGKDLFEGEYNRYKITKKKWEILSNEPFEY